MATIKSYTDLEQSKKLAEILALESADMYYSKHSLENYYSPIPLIGKYSNIQNEIPCWSLAALLNALPKIMNHETLFVETSPSLWHIGYRNVYIARADTLVDACYEMIIKLHELNLL